MLLDHTRLLELRTAFLACGIGYDALTRNVLLQGVPPSFVFTQPVAPVPAVQLGLDLGAFNQIERLTDGTVPLELWLTNALGLAGLAPQASVLRDILSEVVRKSSGAPSIPQPAASLPSVPEKIIGRDDTLPAGFLAGGARLIPSVARLVVPRHQNGAPLLGPSGNPVRYLGTGWLVTSDLLITNHHVVNARNEGEPVASAVDLLAQAAGIVIQFDYDSAAAAPHEETVGKLEIADPQLDFALLRLGAAQPAARPPIPLSRQPLQVAGAADYLAVNILQHPGGQPKRVALRNNLVYSATSTVIRYFADTQGGSSGSPVCNDSWVAVALHRAAVPVQQIEFQGQKEGWVNEGTQILPILEHLQQQRPDLYQEIVGS